MSVYLIKDLEHLSGIKAHTIRIWEQRYSLFCPKRTDTNIRYYDDYDLKLILNVALLKENGFKISKIAKMTKDDLKKEVIVITEKCHKCPDQIQALTLAMVDLNEERFEKVIATNILQRGFEKTMLEVIYPFLIRIGSLWQTGAINPAQEHFISHLIRQKLIVAIDGQICDNPQPLRFLLFLPEGELHELSLLFASYIIKSRNHKVIYLGQSLPFKDLEITYNIHQPDFLLTVFTACPGQGDVQEYVQNLEKRFQNCQLLISGSQIVGQDITVEENTIIIRKIQDLVQFVEDQT